MHTFAQIVRDFHLPLYQSFSSIESQNNRHVLAYYSYSIGFLVKSETTLHAEKMLQT